MITVPKIPIEDFFRNPEKIFFKISPSGKYISYLAPYQNRLNIHVQNMETDEVKRITNDTERDIRKYLWTSDETVAYLQDTGGDENDRLYTVDIQGNNFKEITPYKGVKVEFLSSLIYYDDELLILMNKRNPQVFDVYRVNVKTGDIKMIYENPGDIGGMIPDKDGDIRSLISMGIERKIYYRAKGEEDFKLLIRTDFKNDFELVSLTSDKRYVHAISNIGRDKKALIKYDTIENKEVELIYENKDVDILFVLKSNKRNKLLFVFYDSDKYHLHFIDEETKAIYDKLEESMGRNYFFTINSRNANENKLLIVKISDVQNGIYYFYDTITNTLKELAQTKPWLKEEHLCEMKPIKYQTRDGLTIHGYLTLPKNKEAKNLPVVVNPHGGPELRDSWGYNPEVQFLANRGYAVLQMNFRCSRGYGRAFWEAGFKQWGLAMQDDITDGVHWLIEQGIADPKRIAIYGASYGGYATLMGIVKEPDLFACAIDKIGPSNLFTFLASVPAYWKPALKELYEKWGHPEEDADYLKAVSPVFHVDKIKTPLMIAQGANDPRVKQAESDQMVEALRKRGIDVKYILKEDEGHGFHKEENKMEFYREMEAFLAKYLS